MSQSQQVQHLIVGDGDHQRPIAYLTQPRNASRSGPSNLPLSAQKDTPGILWLQGYKSEMLSLKATALADWTQQNGLAYTRFDYSGHGQSCSEPGARFEDGTISRWLEETLAIFKHVSDGPQIVVGSSMGGYLALLLTRNLQAAATISKPSRVAGIVMIAPAWDMTEELMWKRAPEEIRRQITERGVWYRPSKYSDEPYPITRGLIEDGRENLLGTTPWNPGCPVEIIHGRQDPDVPYEHSERLVASLTGAPVYLTEVPDGEHRLSRPQDLELLLDRIAALL
jgi:pimeloyl-ACP methyl ester carboxylesterase